MRAILRSASSVTAVLVTGRSPQPSARLTISASSSDIITLHCSAVNGTPAVKAPRGSSPATSARLIVVCLVMVCTNLSAAIGTAGRDPDGSRARRARSSRPLTRRGIIERQAAAEKPPKPPRAKSPPRPRRGRQPTHTTQRDSKTDPTTALYQANYQGGRGVLPRAGQRKNKRTGLDKSRSFVIK